MRYTVGTDTIEVGPGVATGGGCMSASAGEAYSWRGGQLRAEGVRVYLTGITPFHTCWSCADAAPLPEFTGELIR